MSQKLNFAIIGCGKIAPRHAENIVRVGKLVAVCDILIEKADHLALQYNARAYNTLEELLKKEPGVEIVTVCTPNGLHSEHSIQSLKAGKHVLCEKPMCITTADAAKMKKVATEAGKNLFVVKQNRYNPPVVAIKELIDNNILGKILSVQVNGFWNRDKKYFLNSWKGTKKLDGGILYTQFSHFIDLAYWLAGNIKTVKAIKKNLLLKDTIETEDNCVVVAEFESGALGSFHFSINTFEKNMEGSITIIAEKGTVKIGGQYLNTLEYQRVDGIAPIKIDKGNLSNDYGFYEGSMSNHDKVYENLLVALTNPGHAFAGAEDGMKTVEIIEKIYASCF
jgi:UDP-N-acetyl-2-amino-2-deoxyglucuronate dehydrogenase